MARNYRVEKSQIYLTGLSMGGGATWYIAAAQPIDSPPSSPISGVGDPARATQLATLPIWVFHGAKDTIISVDWSRKMVAAIKAAGGTINYTEFPQRQAQHLGEHLQQSGTLHLAAGPETWKPAEILATETIRPRY